MKKIAVIGSLNMDLTAKAQRIPCKGETVSGWDLKYLPGGKGANQAVAAARLGGKVAMYGCVGDDAFADKLIENLVQNGVDASHVKRVADTSSGIAMITVAENDNSIVVIPGANNYVTKEYLHSVKDCLLEADIVIMQNEIPLESVIEAIEMLDGKGKAIIYNPAPVAPLFDGAMVRISYLTPNEHEAALLFPKNDDLSKLLESQNGKLIVTLGKDGVAACENGKVIHIPARPAKVVDTTGAGDTFNGAFAYALANDYNLEKALCFANVAASISTERAGAQGGMPTLDEVIAEL